MCLMDCHFCFIQQKALHVRALRTYKDDFGVTRKNGEEWLITMKDTETHIPNVYEEVHTTNQFFQLFYFFCEFSGRRFNLLKWCLT